LLAAASRKGKQWTTFSTAKHEVILFGHPIIGEQINKQSIQKHVVFGQIKALPKCCEP